MRVLTPLFRIAIVLILAGVMGGATPSAAQSPITASLEAESSYPNGIMYRLDASSSAGDITDARLSLRPVGGQSRQNLPFDFDAAPSVTSEVQFGRRPGTLPPGALYEYQLRVRDSAGNEYLSEPERFAYYPTGNEWQEITEGNATFVWYEGSQEWAQEMVALSAPAVERAANDYGVEVDAPVRIVAFPDTSSLRDALPDAPDWIGGITLSDMGMTIQYISPEESQRGWNEVVIPHEIAHLVFDIATPSTFAPIPNWLSEGLAMYNEPGDHSNDREVVEQAASDGELYRLSELRSEPFGDHSQVSLAYSMGWHIVNFMVEDCGQDGLRELITQLNTGKSLDDALTAACGYDEKGLYNAWYTSLTGNAPPSDPGATSESPTTADEPDVREDPTIETEPEVETVTEGESSGSSGLPRWFGTLLVLGGMALGFMGFLFFIVIIVALRRA